MKRMIALLIALALLGMPVLAAAQQVSPGAAVTQTGSTGLAAQQCIQVTGTNSAQQTITVPAQAGNSVYFDYITASIYGTGAVTTTATIPVVTTTNIAGTPTWPFGTAYQSSTAAGSIEQAVGLPGPLGIPIKAQFATSPTIVGPAAVAAYFQFLTACFHYAP